MFVALRRTGSESKLSSITQITLILSTLYDNEVGDLCPARPIWFASLYSKQIHGVK